MQSAGQREDAAADAYDDDVDSDAPVPNADQLVAECVTLAAKQIDTDPQLCELVAQYWRLVPHEEMAGRSAPTLLAATISHRELAGQRVQGELKMRVALAPDQSHTAIEIVTDDMPFLVDSVTAALTARTLDTHLLVHPLFVVSREALGKLREIHLDREPEQAEGNQLVESWMRIEVDPIRSADDRLALHNDLVRVLTDVRETVEDWPKMRQQALGLADELASAQLPVPDKDITDSIELLRWLVDGHFTFLGYREYRLGRNAEGELLLEAQLGTGLGILRGDQPHGRVLSSMSPEAYAKALEKRLLIITKANSRATVHRAAYLDYIGFKVFDPAGEVIGERRFLGLFSSAAYRTSVRELPVVRRKVAEVLDRSGLSPRSHSGKDLMEILETYPRDELFQIATDELYRSVIGVLRLAGRRQLRVFLRRDAYGRFISCLVYLPRDKFTTVSRLKMQDILLRELNGVGVDYTTRVTESPLARVHFIVRTDPANPPGQLDVDVLTERLAAATRLWEDDFRLVLENKMGGEGAAKELYLRYAYALPEAYKDEHDPGEAVKDVAKLELLDEPGELVMHLYRKRRDDENVRFKVYRDGEPMLLSAVLPVLHSLGVSATDERPYEVKRTEGTVYMYDFGLTLPPGSREVAEVRAQVENAFSAAWRGEAEVDGFNALVLTAGLTWRQVVVLRAYAKYLRQAGTIFSQDYMESTLLAYPGIAALLVALFETRFDPRLRLTGEDREIQAKELVAALHRQLDNVQSLDQDRIVRSYLTLITSTLRTSFFQRDMGRPKSYVAFKLDPQAIPELPAPRPKFEIFVYSPRFEGVHLRFGSVARGGLRWSDRREDFRTEILGLVKAQMVKNAVIVPTGAKGGFVLKRAPADREALAAEGVACYKLFISALLDVTDNLVNGTVIPPVDVVRHDPDDPYLVVAADKGTATFSDTANEISVKNGFWMGDAFASGGSAGYDHKKMGITARGAWELVKKRLRDLGCDTQSQEFTVVGVGDMSGDVFGNGMLLSEHIRLVAAFDHRHIFVDPTPDAATSYAERRRLFDLPRSSWADYDQSLISAGGGVFARTLKSVPVSPEARAALGLPDSVEALTPAELMKAILKAPVDLFWNGGIGTYVKATSEANSDVGDKANDAIRINGREMRANVIGEGGNLGATQLGRIEYAQVGGREHTGGQVATDFIDNSAGVDCSDHEVNIKILLARAVAAGELGEAERNDLLATMTDEVGALVLRDNYDQAVALGNAGAQAHSLLPVHRRLISELERRGALDRELEDLPSDEELAARGDLGRGLTTPEFSVLLAYVKIVLEREILDSEVPDEPWTADVLRNYFPTPLRERYADRMAEHPLRREIVTTVLVNEAVNRSGTSFFYRATDETGASWTDVLRAYIVVRDIYGLRELWAATEALDNKVPTSAQTLVYLEARRLLDRSVRWLVSNRRSPIDVPGEIERLRPGLAELLPRLDSLIRGNERDSLHRHAGEMAAAGLPGELAEWATRLMYGFGLLDVVEVAHNTGQPIEDVAKVYFVISERFRVDDLLSRISALPREDRWQTLARMALRYDLYAALAALTSEVVTGTSGTHDAEARVLEWERSNAASITRARNAIGELEDSSDLAALSVLLRQIRTMVRTSAAT